MKFPILMKDMALTLFSIFALSRRTLTSPVDFKTCLVAIKENAFHKTDYPVIVTLEDHLTPQLQAKAAEVHTSF